ncbi:MAG: hypothetical protein Q4F29_04990 [Lachnospiraceae bacterium]|nr:hypothetical protein [Lachnospiraceae bacterium]
MGEYRLNISAPNLVCICIDEISDGDYSGKVFHRYSETPISFQKIGQLITKLDRFYNEINYPQASTRDRTFQKKKKGAPEEPVRRPKPVSPIYTSDQVLENRGKVATLALHVQFRQNSSWQGRVLWLEEKESETFYSVLELLKIMDGMLSEEE